MIFILIVDKLQTLDVLSHEINDFSTHRGQITDFGCAAPRDHRFFFSSWRNVRPVDVLPHQSTELSSQYADVCFKTRRRALKVLERTRHWKLMPDHHQEPQFLRCQYHGKNRDFVGFKDSQRYWYATQDTIVILLNSRIQYRFLYRSWGLRPSPDLRSSEAAVLRGLTIVFSIAERTSNGSLKIQSSLGSPYIPLVSDLLIPSLISCS
ncbi:hypothetical protein TNCV_2743731 [Trichonephila clavipes]|nr:hypothetical protein TNCV_2743731 [Trichonephila clavipes]